MEGSAEFISQIKSHLDKKAKEDSVFAEKYASEKKSIEKCCDYILTQVKKSGKVAFAGEEIISMAIHYYDESNPGKISELTTAAGRIVSSTVIELTEEDRSALRHQAEEEYMRECRESIIRKMSAPVSSKKKVEAAEAGPSLF